VRMRLALVISSLSSGGAERVMSIMANYWAAKGWAVRLFTFDDGREAPFYALHCRVAHVSLGIAGESANPMQGIIRNLGRIRTLRQAIQSSSPDAVIAFMDKTNVLALLAATGLKVPVVVSERNDPRLHPIGTVWNWLRKWAYRRAFRLVVQTESAKSCFPPAVQRRTVVIPNPVVLPPGNTTKNNQEAHKQIISIGRLTPQKGFDMLIQAFARVASRHPDWSLVIWGEGDQRGPLEELRDGFGLRDRVLLPGRTRDPHEKLRQSILFVLSSRFEGFPNALCEAMACGLPVISFDCPSGPREIIRDNVDGVLVPEGDREALASVMERLISDENERKRLSSRAVEVTERFALEKIMAKWEQVLHDAVGEPGR